MQGCLGKNETFSRVPLKEGLRVYFKETEGLFCKNADDVRPEAIAALLVYIYILAKMPVRCNGYKIDLSVHVIFKSLPVTVNNKIFQLYWL